MLPVPMKGNRFAEPLDIPSLRRQAGYKDEYENDPIMAALLGKPPITEGLFQGGVGDPGTIPEIQARLARSDVPSWVAQGAQTHFEDGPLPADNELLGNTQDFVGKFGAHGQRRNMPRGHIMGGNYSLNLPDPFGDFERARNMAGRPEMDQNQYGAPIELVNNNSHAIPPGTGGPMPGPQDYPLYDSQPGSPGLARTEATRNAIARGASFDWETGALKGRSDSDPLARDLMRRIADNRAKMAGQKRFVPQALRGGVDLSMIRAMARGNQRDGMDPEAAQATAYGMGLGNNGLLLGGLLGPGVVAAGLNAQGQNGFQNNRLVMELMGKLFDRDTALGAARLGFEEKNKDREYMSPENIAKRDLAAKKIKYAEIIQNPNSRYEEAPQSFNEEWAKSGYDLNAIPPQLKRYLQSEFQSGGNAGYWTDSDAGNYARAVSQKTGLPADVLHKVYNAFGGGNWFGRSAPAWNTGAANINPQPGVEMGF